VFVLPTAKGALTADPQRHSVHAYGKSENCIFDVPQHVLESLRIRSEAGNIIVLPQALRKRLHYIAMTRQWFNKLKNLLVFIIVKLVR
jgi:hypothetical protein